MTPTNLFATIPTRDPAAAEWVETLLQRTDLRIERIVSHGQASPPGFWYDQPEGEWILLLSGSAGLRFEQAEHTCLLVPGDCLDILAHCRHRVEWTAQDTPTVWLAVFYGGDTASPGA